MYLRLELRHGAARAEVPAAADGGGARPPPVYDHRVVRLAGATQTVERAEAARLAGDAALQQDAVRLDELGRDLHLVQRHALRYEQVHVGVGVGRVHFIGRGVQQDLAERLDLSYSQDQLVRGQLVLDEAALLLPRRRGEPGGHAWHQRAHRQSGAGSCRGGEAAFFRFYLLSSFPTTQLCAPISTRASSRVGSGAVCDTLQPQRRVVEHRWMRCPRF